MDEGLRRVYVDKEVLVMAEIANKNRSVDLFVKHGIDQSNDILSLEGECSPKQVRFVLI